MLWTCSPKGYERKLHYFVKNFLTKIQSRCSEVGLQHELLCLLMLTLFQNMEIIGVPTNVSRQPRRATSIKFGSNREASCPANSTYRCVTLGVGRVDAKFLFGTDCFPCITPVHQYPLGPNLFQFAMLGKT